MVRDTPMVHNERTKGKKQKLGFPIKDFRHDGGGGRQPWRPPSSRCLSFLKASIRNLNYLRAKASGFPLSSRL